MEMRTNTEQVQSPSSDIEMLERQSLDREIVLLPGSQSGLALA